jgi:anti-sigma factor RsiW
MHELLVSDALDLAFPGEEAIVGAHVASCRACATTLIEFQHIAACLGAAVPQIEPPAALRRRVIDATRRKTAADPALAKNNANPSNGAADADH